MTTRSQQQSYSVAQGTSFTSAFLFNSRDPSSNDIGPPYPIYQGWINTNTKAIWYLETLSSSGGFINAIWRAVGPIVTSSSDPTTADYQYPSGQTWVNTVSNNYWVLLSVTGTTALWAQISSSTGSVLFLTGNSGGDIYPASGGINIVGSGSVSVAGAGNTLTITNSSLFSSQVVTSVDNPVFLVPNTIYISKGAVSVVFRLPVTASVGEVYKIVGYGNLWQLTQGAGQIVYIGSAQTTAGFFGSLTATMAHDTIELVCVTSNTEWQVVSMMGNPTII